MATTAEDLAPHVSEDLARKDAMVRDLCDRLGFDFVMESAARQAALRPARKPVATRAAATPKGVETIHAAMQDLEKLTASGKGLRMRVQATETLEQMQAFLKAAGQRTIIGTRPAIAVGFAYDAGTETLMVAGLSFPLATLNASHGRLYSQPYDEAKTIHTLTMYDGGAGTSIELGLA